jgi:hypothetical protein
MSESQMPGFHAQRRQSRDVIMFSRFYERELSSKVAFQLELFP